MNIKTQRLGAKTLLVVGVVGASFWLTNCGDNVRKIEEKPIDITKYIPVEGKNFNYVGHIVKHLAASRDGNNLYVTVDSDAVATTVGKYLFHNSGSDLSQGWNNVKLETDQFDDTVGKAKLEPKDVTMISPAKDGVLISVTGTKNVVPPHAANFLDNGVIYFKGDKAESAWANKAIDVDSVPALGAVAGKFFVSTPIKGVVVTKDKDDVPYFFGNNSTAPNTYVAMTRADLQAGIVSAPVSRATTAFAIANNLPKLASSKDFLFSVDAIGVTAIAKADIGVTKAFPNLGAGGATTAQADGSLGIENFRMKTGVANGVPTSVVATDKYLYIGFEAPADYNGGVGVYEIQPTGTAPTFKAPDVSWRGIAVKQLLIDAKGKVWAVTAGDVIEVKDDFKKGASYVDQFDAPVETYDNAKAGFKKESFPREGITVAAFVKDQLVIGTNKGLFVPKVTKKSIAGTKVIEVEEGK